MTFKTYRKTKFTIAYDTFFVFHRVLLNLSNAEEKILWEENALRFLKNQDADSISFSVFDDFESLQETLVCLADFAYSSIDEFVARMDKANEARREIAGILDVLKNSDLSSYPSEIEFSASN